MENLRNEMFFLKMFILIYPYTYFNKYAPDLYPNMQENECKYKNM